MTIEDASQEELHSIAAYLAGKEDMRPAILVGGWAVYAYNTYSKSTDIDLVLGGKRKGRLVQWLRDTRGYAKAVDHVHGWVGASKHVPGVGELIVDVAGHEEEYPFEGRQERLDFDLAAQHAVTETIAGHQLLIPTRSLLVLYKAKAAFDRATRLANGTSTKPAWERGKLVKDRADILALLDAPGKQPWEVTFLGEELRRLPFLIPVLRAAAADADGVARYGRCSPALASAMMEEFLATVT